MPEGKLLGYAVVYLPENRAYSSPAGERVIVDILTLPQAEKLASECREAWDNCEPQDTQVVALYGLPYEAPVGEQP